MKPTNKKLLALTTAALALPGMAPKISVAQSIPEKFVLSYRYSQYQENEQAVSEDETVERYDISIHQLGFIAPVSSNISLSLDASTESMSGASPWYVVEGDDGEAIQVMSGATIDEKRDDIAFAANYYREKSRLGAGISRSEENDYESTSANINSSFWFNDKNTTLDFGVSATTDDIAPTQAPVIDPNRITEGSKDSQSVSVGFSQVMSKTLLVGASASYAVYDGYLSDPYKLASVNGTVVRDSRPDTKEQLSFDLKARKYLASESAALHADYRYYDNNWGIQSHTLSLGWYQNFGSWQLSARLRGYDQRAANFFRNFYIAERADGYYSSDYRLSGYGSVSFRLGVTKNFESSAFHLTFENYNSHKGLKIFGDDSGDSELTGGDLSPGLVDFMMITGGLDYKF